MTSPKSITSLVDNRDQFLRFLKAARESVEMLVEQTRSGSPGAVVEDFRILHTLEAESGLFAVDVLVRGAINAQAVLQPYLAPGKLPMPALAEYLKELEWLRTELDIYLRNDPRLSILARDGAGQDAAKISLRNRLNHFDRWLQSMATSLTKELKGLIVEGGDIEVWPEPYQDFFSVMSHAFRNAIDHGIESSGERLAAGKPLQGEIRVKVTRAPGELVFEISDDGRGIDPEQLRHKLSEKFPGRDFSSQSDEAILRNVFLPGFSLREPGSGYSGRGIGLDALNTEVAKLGGRCTIESQIGKGCTLTIYLPEIEQISLWPKAG